MTVTRRALYRRGTADVANDVDSVRDIISFTPAPGWSAEVVSVSLPGLYTTRSSTFWRGSRSTASIPSDALFDESGQPLFNEFGQYIRVES